MPKKSGTEKRRSFGSIRKKGPDKFLPYFKVDGRPRYGTVCATKTEAILWLARQQVLLAEGRWTEPGIPDPRNTETPTFGEYALDYIKNQTTSLGYNLKPSTQALYRSYLRRGLKTIVDLPITSITKPLVDKLWSEWIAEGKYSTASKYYKFVNAVFNRAIQDGWLGDTAKNPCQVKGAQNASSRRPLRTPSLAEATALANAITPRFRVALLLCAYTGLRFGELAALRRSDLSREELEGNHQYVLSISRSVVRVEGVPVVGMPKSLAGIRNLVVPEKLTPLIDEYLRARADQEGDALLFPSASGTYVRNDVLNKAMREAAVRAGLEPAGLSPHSYRRAAATDYSNRGANITEVQKLLGDASPNAALRYIQPTNRSVSLINKMGSESELGTSIWEKADPMIN